MLNVDLSKCTGCTACVNSCPKSCIHMVPGEFGFNYPRVNLENCINCNRCNNVCPIGKNDVKPKVIPMAAINSDDRILKDSTSGGVFFAIAEAIINQGGFVYGCKIDEDLKVKHCRARTVQELLPLMGSKYVQSDVERVFSEVLNDLKTQKLVLFTGTPCQIHGLKRFLGKEYQNLILVDIICHGVSSQAYFDKYLKFLESNRGKVLSIKFRDKSLFGWSCGGSLIFENNQKKVKFTNFDNFYYFNFLSGNSYRMSCYDCQYANLKRQSDITLGDFWGAESLELGFPVKDGVSLVLVNTEKGKKVIQNLNSLVTKKVKIEEAIRKNEQLKQPSILTKDRELALQEFNELSGYEIQSRFLASHKSELLKGKIKSLIPYKIKLFLRGNFK